MSFGFQFNRATGAALWGSSDFGGLFVAAPYVTRTGGTVTYTYPNYTGKTLKLISVQDGVTISYPGGVPQVDIDTSPTSFVNRILYIFAI